jgi:lipoxygenase
VPRDEDFSEIKQLQFITTTVTNLLHAALPSAQNAAIDPNLGFSSFNAISALYNEGVKMSKVEKSGLLQTLIPCIFGGTQDVSDQLLRFEVPDMLESKISHLEQVYFYFIFVTLGFEKSNAYLYNRRSVLMVAR